MGLEQFSAFLPYDTFAIESPYTPQEVAERIQALIEGPPPAGPLATVKRSLLPQEQYTVLPPFLGISDASHFYLYPATRMGNSMRPHLYGTITPTRYGSIVTGNIQIHSKIRVFLSILLAILSVIFVAVLIAVVLGTWNHTTALWYSGVGLIVGYIVTLLSFKYEASPRKNY